MVKITMKKTIGIEVSPGIFQMSALDSKFNELIDENEKLREAIRYLAMGSEIRLNQVNYILK